ncbi:LAFA_0F15808g1_1 [Lachancea sp. 'fantastica']|nr:LAFA_0F15808g1_1 [Lachancea sp. 'fantastica']
MNSHLSISSQTTQTSSVFSGEEDGFDAKIKEIEDYYMRTLLDEEPGSGLGSVSALTPVWKQHQKQQQNKTWVQRSGQVNLPAAAPQLEVEINPQYMPATGVLPLTSENLKLLQNPKLAPQRPECLKTPTAPEKCNKTLYKTELCESFSTTGNCRYGSNCQFAHGLQELKFKERNNKFRTKPCVNWLKTGSCPYGQRCCFKHGNDVDIKVYLQAGHIPHQHHHHHQQNRSQNDAPERRNHHANVQALQKMAW